MFNLKKFLFLFFLIQNFSSLQSMEVAKFKGEEELFFTENIQLNFSQGRKSVNLNFNYLNKIKDLYDYDNSINIFIEKPSLETLNQVVGWQAIIKTLKSLGVKSYRDLGEVLGLIIDMIKEERARRAAIIEGAQAFAGQVGLSKDLTTKIIQGKKISENILKNLSGGLNQYLDNLKERSAFETANISGQAEPPQGELIDRQVDTLEELEDLIFKLEEELKKLKSEYSNIWVKELMLCLDNEEAEYFKEFKISFDGFDNSKDWVMDFEKGFGMDPDIKLYYWFIYLFLKKDSLSDKELSDIESNLVNITLLRSMKNKGLFSIGRMPDLTDKKDANDTAWLKFRRAYVKFMFKSSIRATLAIRKKSLDMMAENLVKEFRGNSQLDIVVDKISQLSDESKKSKLFSKVFLISTKFLATNQLFFTWLRFGDPSLFDVILFQIKSSAVYEKEGFKKALLNNFVSALKIISHEVSRPNAIAEQKKVGIENLKQLYQWYEKLGISNDYLNSKRNDLLAIRNNLSNLGNDLKKQHKNVFGEITLDFSYAKESSASKDAPGVPSLPPPPSSSVSDSKSTHSKPVGRADLLESIRGIRSKKK